MDASIDAETGMPTCTIFSPYWVMNKSGEYYPLVSTTPNVESSDISLLHCPLSFSLLIPKRDEDGIQSQWPSKDG